MRAGQSDLGHIEHELDHTRSRLDATIGELQQKVAPKEMVEQAVTYFMEGGGVEFTNNLGRSIRDNPIPVAMIGIGIGWLAMSGSRQDHRYGHDHDLYGRRARSPGFGDESTRRPMPYEAAAYDDLATKANEAGSRVERHADEEESAFQERVQAARGAVLGLTRDMGEAAASFRDRVEAAVSAAAERVRGMAASAGSQASYLLDRGQATARELYGHGRSAAGSMRHDAGDMAGRLAERPLLLGAFGVGVGAALGMLVPASRYERRLAGSVRESLRDTVREAAGEARDQVARVAEDVLDTARESCAARGSGRQRPDGAGRRRPRARRGRRRSGASGGRGERGGRARVARDRDRPQPPLRWGEHTVACDRGRYGAARRPCRSARPHLSRSGTMSRVRSSWPEAPTSPMGTTHPPQPRSRRAAGGRCCAACGARRSRTGRRWRVQLRVLRHAGAVPGDLWSRLRSRRHRTAAARSCPAAAYQLVAQRLHDLAAKPVAALSWAGGARVLPSASAGSRPLMVAVNVAYEEDEKRGLIRYYLTGLLPHTPGQRGARPRPALPLCSLAARGRLALDHPGSVFAALLWLAASILSSLYVG